MHLIPPRIKCSVRCARRFVRWQFWWKPRRNTGQSSTTVLRLIQKLRFSEKRPTGKGLPPHKKLVDSVFKRNLAMVQAMQFLPRDKRRQKVEISRVVWLMKLLGAKSFPFARC